jgi:hypothetical protein
MNLPALVDKDPSDLGFPPMLPVELALGNGTPKQLLEEYGLAQDDWERLKHNRVFLQACKEARDMAASEGGSFRMKAKTMAEVLLKDIHTMASEENPNVVPSNVRADLLKFVVRIAGLDASIDQKGAAAGKAGSSTVQAVININLG